MHHPQNHSGHRTFATHTVLAECYIGHDSLMFPLMLPVSTVISYIWWGTRIDGSYTLDADALNVIDLLMKR